MCYGEIVINVAFNHKNAGKVHKVVMCFAEFSTLIVLYKGKTQNHVFQKS